MRGASAGLTASLPEYCLRTFAGFFRRRWLRCPFILSSFPVPVRLKRAAAPLCVLSFGKLFTFFDLGGAVLWGRRRKDHRQPSALEGRRLLQRRVVDQVLRNQFK